MPTNLPSNTVQDSAEATKLFFDQYGISPSVYSSNDVAAAIGFFESRGFGEEAAISTSAAILKQAKSDNVSVFSLIDTLKGLEDVQLSALISEVLNNDRTVTSTLGYRYTNVTKDSIVKSIAP